MSELESSTESHTDKTNYAGRTIYQLSPLMIMLSRPGAAPPPAASITWPSPGTSSAPARATSTSWPACWPRARATCATSADDKRGWPRVLAIVTGAGPRVTGRPAPRVQDNIRNATLLFALVRGHVAPGTWPTARGINSWGRGKITMSNFTDYSKEQWSQVIPVLPSLKVKLHPRGPLLRKWEREKMREKWPLSWCNYYNNLQFRLGPYAVTRQIFIQDVCIYQACMHAFIKPFIW